MNYQLPLREDEAAARVTMPRTTGGFVVSLFFVPPQERGALEVAWREWARGKPEHLRPNWFPAWAEYRKSGSLPAYAIGMRENE